MKKDSKIYIAGHTGLVGSALYKKLTLEGYTNIITKSHSMLDLRDSVQVKWFMYDMKPEYVFVCAAKVGGIYANSTYPVDFLYDNLMIGLNIIKYSYRNEVTKLMYLGSSCIYPKVCPQPIKEEYLLTGKLEETNQAYALAKLSCISLCKAYNKQLGTNYINVLPCSIFGDNDNFDLKNSHFIPAIMRKMHEAKINNQDFVEVWGTGMPCREFLHSDDLADGLLFLMNESDEEVINIGSGIDYRIFEIVEMIKKVVEYKGEIHFDASKPDGTMKKLLCIDKITEMGWKPHLDFNQGLVKLYDWYQLNLLNGDLHE